VYGVFLPTNPVSLFGMCNDREIEAKLTYLNHYQSHLASEIFFQETSASEIMTIPWTAYTRFQYPHSEGTMQKTTSIMLALLGVTGTADMAKASTPIIVPEGDTFSLVVIALGLTFLAVSTFRRRLVKNW
jgi:hypothetical protein